MKKTPNFTAFLPKGGTKKPAAKPEPAPSPAVEKTRDDELYAVSEYLRKLRFRATLVGGVDEADVWRKIEKLCELYADTLTIERGRREALQRQLDALTAKGPGDRTEAADSPAAAEEEPAHGA